MNTSAHSGVSLATLFALPWRTSHASLRWLMVVLMAGSLILAVVFGIHSPKPFLRGLGVGMCCASTGLAWWFWFSASVLLAQDAYRLRVPSAERVVALSLVLHGLIDVIVPALVLGALGANALLAALWLALAACGGLTFALLPRWLALPMGFVPMLAGDLWDHHLLPPLRDPHWPQSGAVALVVLLVVIVWRWRKVARDGDDRGMGFRGAVATQFRRQGTRGDWTGTRTMDSAQLIRQLPGWMQARATLRDAGPQNPVLTLRIALGGPYLPKTLGSHLRGAAPVMFSLLAVPALLLFQGDASAKRVTVLALVGCIVLIFGLAASLLPASVVIQRWRRANAELPLLALLPGLGDAHAQRHQLLRTLFTGPVIGQVVLWTVMLAAAWLLHLRGLSLILPLMTLLAAACCMPTQTLCALGDRRLPTWGEWLFYLPIVALTMASLLIPALAIGNAPDPSIVVSERWTLLGWCVMALPMAWLAHRGWQAFNARSHPFLSID